MRQRFLPWPSGFLRPGLAAGLLMVAVTAAFATPVEVQLVAGDRLTLRAREAPILDVLTRLARCGVTVRMDPRVQGRITADFDRADAEKVLTRALGNYDYVAVWNVVRGPIENLAVLSELQVFPRGETRNLTVVARPTGPAAGHAKAAPSTACVPDEVLLRLKPGADREAFRRLLMNIRGTPVDSLPALGVYRVRLPEHTDLERLLNTLKNNPLIAGAEPNLLHGLQGPIPTSGSQENGALAPVVRPVGDGPAVAVLDSGLLPLEALGPSLIAGFDATDPGRPLTDTLGHGTQMALVASGAITPAGGVSPASGVPLVAIRAFDDQGQATSFALMQGIEFSVQNHAGVISLSWTAASTSAFLEDSVRYAQACGAIVVAAAGNEPTGRATYPAAYEGVISVGATEPDGSLWPPSNRGTFVTLAAPGYASFPVGYQGPAGTYVGTSIAAVYTARTLAEYRARHPGATAAQVVSALRTSLTAADTAHTGQYGGLLDSAAVDRLLQ